MIKCNVSVIGTVSRAAQMRTNKEGKPFLSFGVNVVIVAKSGINKTVEVSVAKDSDQPDEANLYPVGSRIGVDGVLSFHKKEENIYLNLSATSVKTSDIAPNDGITGDIEFRGTLGSKIETKTDKKGNPFCVFSAYSSEKNGEGYDFTWVRFMHFGQAQQEWMQPKAGVDAKGDLQMSVYNDHLEIACRVKEVAPWEKKPFQAEH